MSALTRLPFFAALLALCGFVLSAQSAAPIANEKAKPAPKVRPKVEVVFCLDTTASMTGLPSESDTRPSR